MDKARLRRLRPPGCVPRFILEEFQGTRDRIQETWGIFQPQTGGGGRPTRSGQEGKGKERGYTTGQTTGVCV